MTFHWLCKSASIWIKQITQYNVVEKQQDSLRVILKFELFKIVES